jgi:hypothetical protein
MPVSHAPVPSRAPDAAAGQGQAPGLLEVLAGARSFRETGDQAADLPQDMFAALGGVPCPLRRRIPVPGEKRIRTLLQDLDGDALDVIVGGWLRQPRHRRLHRRRAGRGLPADRQGQHPGTPARHLRQDPGRMRRPGNPRDPGPPWPAGSGPSRPSTGSATPPGGAGIRADLAG